MSLSQQNITVPSFDQPAVGDSVVLRLDSGINWLGGSTVVKIEHVGIYQIVDRSEFNYTLKLCKAILPPGSRSLKSILYPVSASFDELVDGPIDDMKDNQGKIVHVSGDGTRLEYDEEGEIGDFPPYNLNLQNLLNF